MAFYPGNKKVSSLKGWGVSVGASFSAGLHLSGGAGVDIGFDGSLGGNVNVGLGVGASIASVPYTQVRIGGTAILASGNLLTIFNKWKVGAKKIYKALGTKIIMKKSKKYISISIQLLDMTIYI